MATTIDVKVFVDKDKSKVLFAESGKDFVDVLFGFLTLPLGTVVRLLGKQSQAGCLDALYKSVEELPAAFFRTDACKAMLLAPINGAAKKCCSLKVRVDDTKHRVVYVCGDTSCPALADAEFSSVPGAVCKCGTAMAKMAGERPESGGGGGSGSGDRVFVRGDVEFIITDDLQVAPASTSLMLSLFDKFKVDDPSGLEQRTLELSSDKILGLLKRSLISKNPLTGHYFDVAIEPDDAGIDLLPQNLHPEQGNDAEQTLNSVKIKVLQTKNNSSVLYAEVGGDFVDLLFGLLSIPLGSIMKAYGKCASKGCFDNLYSSIDGSAEGCMIPECQGLLLSPKLAPFFGCSASKILQVEELSPNKQSINACFKCFKIGGFANLTRCHERQYVNYGWKYLNCLVDPKTANLCEFNPKSPKGEESDDVEGYVKQGLQNFMVTDDLRVLPLSLACTLQVVREAKIQRKDLVEKEVTLTKSQMIELLKAALVT
ncbi:hypothetical protein BRADI_5g20160v3, partial [Brachypodium distachyon]